jgi:hypothetical protein
MGEGIMNKKQSYQILSYEYDVKLGSKTAKNQAVKDLKKIADFLNNFCVDPEIKFTVKKEIVYGYELYSLNMNAPKIDISDVHLYILQDKS